MDVIFLGFSELNFDTKEGDHIEGVKFFYYFNSSTPNYHGFEIGSLFVSANQKELCDIIRRITPLSKINLNMGFNGRRAIFTGISSIKS